MTIYACAKHECDCEKNPQWTYLDRELLENTLLLTHQPTSLFKLINDQGSTHFLTYQPAVLAELLNHGQLRCHHCQSILIIHHNSYRQLKFWGNFCHCCSNSELPIRFFCFRCCHHCNLKELDIFKSYCDGCIGQCTKCQSPFLKMVNPYDNLICLARCVYCGEKTCYHCHYKKTDGCGSGLICRRCRKFSNARDRMITNQMAIRHELQKIYPFRWFKWQIRRVHQELLEIFYHPDNFDYWKSEICEAWMIQMGI